MTLDEIKTQITLGEDSSRQFKQDIHCQKIAALSRFGVRHFTGAGGMVAD